MSKKPVPHPLQSLKQCRSSLTPGATYCICKRGNKYLTLRNNEIAWSAQQGDATVFDDMEHLNGWLEVAAMDSLNERELTRGGICGVELTIKPTSQTVKY